jgi:hypothetical protein
VIWFVVVLSQKIATKMDNGTECDPKIRNEIRTSIRIKEIRTYCINAAQYNYPSSRQQCTVVYRLRDGQIMGMMICRHPTTLLGRTSSCEES